MDSLKRSKIQVFFLTFFSYVMFHASRKSFSAVKGQMSKEKWMESNYFDIDEQGKMYGLMDTLFMSFYAGGLYISGILGDRYDLRLLIARGMIITACVMFCFGFGAMGNIHAFGFYAFLWAFNGLVQSIGWPTNVAVMGNWFKQHERGAVMGIWSGNACFGNIVGTAIVSISFLIFQQTLAWKAALAISGGFVFVHALLIYQFLPIAPPLVSNLEDKLPKEQELLLKMEDTESPIGISFWKAWRIPGVIPYALSYACLKSVNYALFFWIPFYLSSHFHMDDSTAGFYSMLYDLGQIFGGFCIGYVTDKINKRSPVIVVMMLLAVFTISQFRNATHTEMTILLLTSGFLLGGPANLISTAIAADLGTHESIRLNTSALSTVTGIIDGTGSVGAALIQYLVGYLANCHTSKSCLDDDVNATNCVDVTCNWDPVFVLLQVSGLLACVLLLKMVWHELLY